MVIERKGDAAVRDRVQRIDGDHHSVIGAYQGMPEVIDWTLWLVDAPGSRGPDAAAIEAIITAYRRSPLPDPMPCSVRRC